MDGAGNAAACSSTVTVLDTVPPSITCPPDVTAECNAPGAATGVSAGHATVSDVCSGSLTVDEPGVATYPLGTTTVSHTVADDSGNPAACNNKVTVADTTAPAFDQSSLGARTLLGNCSGTALSFALPTATDGCQSVTVSCQAVAGNSFGANSITCTAQDVSGNQKTAQLTVNVLQPLHIVFDSPLADDNVANDITTDADAANVFQVKSTIPHQVRLLDCLSNDVTTSAAVSVKLGVTKRSDSSIETTNVLPTYTGAGDAGGLMVLVDGKYKYNLKTTGYDSGTVYSSGFYDAVVSVNYSSNTSIVVGQEDARLESK